MTETQLHLFDGGVTVREVRESGYVKLTYYDANGLALWEGREKLDGGVKVKAIEPLKKLR